ncbi:MAG: membrane-bound lytic murein transglycosylase MltF [Halofilum sp. (in: g-proteobacteria)]|nr:membrane-bound lytic murein transglycosylase MltF [Halofilum sp. (in: g-proteobacteria)]
MDSNGVTMHHPDGSAHHLPLPRARPRAPLRLALALAVTAVAGGTPEPAQARSLAAIERSGELRVLTRNAPTTWYIDRTGRPAGPEYELVEAFAAAIGVEAVYDRRASVGAIIDALAAGEGDLAAAGLTTTAARRERFRFGPAYQAVTQQVVCRRDNVQPETLRQLASVDDVAVIADSSYAELLRALERQGYPVPQWRAAEGTTTETLLYRVWRRELDGTVADSTIVDINRRYLPELLTPMNLSREQQLAWMLPPDAAALEAAITDWLGRYRARGDLAGLHEKYYGFFKVFDYVDTRVLIRRTDERFPKYRHWFRAAAAEHGLGFTLLAAQGYQESHWDPRAASPTGVRGIMMLTRTTARAVGVQDRLDPRQSIFGGARYMARMKGRFVDAVGEPDRTFLALAAYNVGRAHLHDAQVLARRKGLSPHHWRDIKQVLPLLAQPRYYRDLKYGYARGREPVRYVQRIREYQHVLENELRAEAMQQAWLE